MSMTNRQRVHAIMNYEKYDMMPVMHFGFWPELLQKWVNEGHLKPEEITDKNGEPPADYVAKKLGFDLDFCRLYGDFSTGFSLYPAFEPKVIKKLADGSYHELNEEGVVVLQKPDVRSIPMEIEHTLIDRASWEKHYLPRLQYTEDRFDDATMKALAQQSNTRTEPLGINCKSLYGQIRNWLGVVGISYLYADDEDLYDEIINTVGDLIYKSTERLLKSGIKFDSAHFWEDICFNHGPLINPAVFKEKVGPHYRRITSLLNEYGVNIISVDCDGLIDLLIPTWIENGVNTMFPIEVGTWNASIAPWREKYGKELRGIGGMNKNLFGRDKAAIDAEIERLKPLVNLGGYIPCPDHRIPPDAKWSLIKYYCEKAKTELS